MDDWDDEDADFIPAVAAGAVGKTSWEDEDEEEVIAKVVVSAASIEAAAKKAKEEEIRLNNVLKFAVLEDETSDEKRARERKQIEDADAELAGELFGGGGKTAGTPKAAASISSGVAASSVKSKADHIAFGTLCAKKLADSNAFNVGAYYKQLTEKIQKNLSLETCDEVLAILTKIRDEKKKAEPVKAVVTAKKSKSQLKAEVKKHSDIFGGGDGSYDDKFDRYIDMEDDYM